MAEVITRQRKKSASRKVQLLEIAAKIFAEEGYKETGIESILKQAGLTGRALYRHFSSKQEILDTICISSVQDALQAASDVLVEHDLSPEEMLRKLVRVRLDYLFSSKGNATILTASQKAHLSESARDAIRTMQREFRGICGALLRKIRSNLNDEEIKVIFFSSQNMLIYSMWRARSRGILSKDDHKLLLEKIIWSTFFVPLDQSSLS